jgi:hypothetical protein
MTESCPEADRLNAEYTSHKLRIAAFPSVRNKNKLFSAIHCSNGITQESRTGAVATFSKKELQGRRIWMGICPQGFGKNPEPFQSLPTKHSMEVYRHRFSSSIGASSTFPEPSLGTPSAVQAQRRCGNQESPQQWRSGGEFISV